MSDRTPTCAARPGRHLPCRTCGVGSGEPCRLPTEVWRDPKPSSDGITSVITRASDGRVALMYHIGHGWVEITSIPSWALESIVAEHERAKRAEAALAAALGTEAT